MGMLCFSSRRLDLRHESREMPVNKRQKEEEKRRGNEKKDDYEMTETRDVYQCASRI